SKESRIIAIGILAEKRAAQSVDTAPLAQTAIAILQRESVAIRAKPEPNHCISRELWSSWRNGRGCALIDDQRIVDRNLASGWIDHGALHKCCLICIRLMTYTSCWVSRYQLIRRCQSLRC